MTVTGSYTPDTYTGDASTVIFPYTFKIFAEADLRVILVEADGTEVVQTLTSDYSVSGVGVAGGGNVTMVAAPAATEDLVIKYDLDITQPYDYTENDPFPAATHENALDRGRIIDQQQQEEIDRCLKNTESDPTAIAWSDVTDAVAATAADVVSTNADVVLTHADVVLTGLDVDATNADVVSTNADVVSTNADAASTAADVISTAADAVSTAADAVSTAADLAAFELIYDGTDLAVGGTLGVTGETTLSDHLNLGAGADLIGSSTSDITINTNKFTVAGATGNTLVAGTFEATGAVTLTGAVGAAASITLGAGADLIGSATSDITINTDKFTVAGATGNTLVAGTFEATGAITLTGAVGAAASITLGAGADLIGSSTSDITINTDKFTVAGATGNTLIAGTLDVTGLTNLTGNTVVGDASLVGDGTLHVHTATAGAVSAFSNGASDIVIEGDNATGIGMTLLGTDAINQNILFGSPSDANGANIQYNYSLKTLKFRTTTASGELIFGSGNGTEAARIDASQRLLVGHTASITGGVWAGKLQVIGADTSAAFNLSRYSNDPYAAALTISKSRGAIGAYTIVQDNDGVANIAFTAADGTDVATQIARIDAEVDDATPAANAIGGAFTISTATTAGVLTEAVRVANDQSTSLYGPTYLLGATTYFSAAYSTYITGNQINSAYNADADGSGLWINYAGYVGGATRSRDLYIGNGKNAAIAYFDGATGYIGINESSPDEMLHLTGTTPKIKLEDTSAGVGTSGISFLKISASPAAWDILGALSYNGLNSVSAVTEYARTLVYSENITDGTECGAVSHEAYHIGANISWLTFYGAVGEVVVNDGGVDIDFRVESDTVTNALFVDGATGGVFMGGLKTGATQVAAGAAADEVWVTSGHATLPDGVHMQGA